MQQHQGWATGRPLGVMEGHTTSFQHLFVHYLVLLRFFRSESEWACRALLNQRVQKRSTISTYNDGLGRTCLMVRDTQTYNSGMTASSITSGTNTPSPNVTLKSI